MLARIIHLREGSDFVEWVSRQAAEETFPSHETDGILLDLNSVLITSIVIQILAAFEWTRTKGEHFIMKSARIDLRLEYASKWVAVNQAVNS